jgi:signal transduction histidine kinase
MIPAASLTNRIFLASALLVAGATGLAIYRVNVSVAARAEDELRVGLGEAATLVEELARTQFTDFTIKGSLIADLPVLKGAAATEHPPTVQPIAEDYQRRIGADLFVVFGRDGRLLARAGRIQPDADAASAMLDACRSSSSGSTYWPQPVGLLRVAAIPLQSNGIPFGTLLVGFALDQQVARRIKGLTDSDIVFGFDRQIVASTLEAGATADLGEIDRLPAEFSRLLGGESYVGRIEPLGDREGGGPVAIVLRSRTRHLSFLPSLRWQIAMAGLAAVLFATGVGYAVARTVTRPVRALTSTMREMAATGDLGKAVPPSSRWDDEDARLLSATFGQLTGALLRFQREAAQRERLSSLGRLSTVIAHEIRNPLMIIKSVVHGLRRRSEAGIADAALSIDEEVQRLNQLVTEVLDFAKPVRLELLPADLADIARGAADAVAVSAGLTAVVEVPPGGAPAVTDAARLRAVLVNLLQNAVAAVRERNGPEAAAGITLRVLPGTGDRWRVEVEDCGTGIAPADLPRVFEPFFTRRPGGSGVGLALARNVIEGLGGTITIESVPDAGTTVRIDLPARSAPWEERA